MSLLYTICAVVGGTLFFLQFLFSLFGGGHDGGHIATHHAGAGGDSHSVLSGMLSFRAVVAALTAFGLGGLATHTSGVAPGLSLAFAVFCALATMLIVALMTRSMKHLEADGTLNIQQAVGRTGTVYLTIPEKKSGAGKVTLSLQNRTIEIAALTPADALPTGTKVTVTSVLGTDTVEVTKST